MASVEDSLGPRSVDSVNREVRSDDKFGIENISCTKCICKMHIDQKQFCFTLQIHFSLIMTEAL